MRKLLFYLTIVTLLATCSHSSKHSIQKGTFTLDGSVYNEQHISKDLSFNVTSWYQELTLLFEVQLSRINHDSPFFKWFSSYEQKIVRSCTDFLFTLSYSLNPRKISQEMFLKQMDKNGYQKILIPQFMAVFKMHPEFDKRALGLYKAYGLCKKSKILGKNIVKIDYPGFVETQVQ
ncbi:MAG: hypothetical protein ISR65_13645 [Bacteriovoracaceae bacterium]|nr:hypothetical protein [Bacteriovoracaceae bacterium]